MPSGSHFEDFAPGQVIDCGTITVEEDEVLAFARRFDPQPMHVDEAAAATGPFGGLIASGWHTAGLVMRQLVGHYIPQAGLASPGIDELRWLWPVRPGDVLAVRVTVQETARSRSKPDRGVVRSLVEARNQDGQTVMTMRPINLVLARGNK